jgi:hypothetical protein
VSRIPFRYRKPPASEPGDNKISPLAHTIQRRAEITSVRADLDRQISNQTLSSCFRRSAITEAR